MLDMRLAASADATPYCGGMVNEHREQRDVHNYFLLPLVDDLRDSITLLRVDPLAGGRVRIHLHRGVNSAAFGMRFGLATEPLWEPVAEPKLTVEAPSPDVPGLTEAETVLADVGEFLGEVAVGDGGIYEWGFEAVLPNDEWVLHLTQLARLHERLEPARRSIVANDPRVVSRMEEIAESADSHAKALRQWLARAQDVANDVVAAANARLHERRVQAVLDVLDGHGDEETQVRTNPDLTRIISS